MPLDVLGRTRATLKEATCLPDSKELGNPLISFVLGIEVCNYPS
jgi:hypothetical protein